MTTLFGTTIFNKDILDLDFTISLWDINTFPLVIKINNECIVFAMNVYWIFFDLMYKSVVYIAGSQPRCKILKTSFKCLSQGKVREFEKSASKHGKIRAFYHVHLSKRESGYMTSVWWVFFIAKWYSLNNNDWLSWLFGVEIPPFLSLAWWLWWFWQKSKGSDANVYCIMEFRKFIGEKSGKNQGIVFPWNAGNPVLWYRWNWICYKEHGSSIWNNF